MRRFSQRAEQLVVSTPATPGTRAAVHARGPVRGQSVAAPGLLGRGGLGGTDRRRAGGRPAQRRAILVSVQRPSRATRPATGSPSPPTRTTGPSATGALQAPHHPVQPRDLDLRAGRTHGHVPCHRADRPVPACWSWTPAAIPARSPQLVAVSPALADQARAGPGPPAGHDADVHQLLWALPVRRPTRWWSPRTSWRSRLKPRGCPSWAPTTLTADWESQRLIAHELSHQWFGNSADRRAAGRTSGSTRASPATPNGSGPRRPA